MKVNKRRASEGGREGGGEAGLPGAGHGAQLRMMGIADWTRKPEADLAGQGRWRGSWSSRGSTKDDGYSWLDQGAQSEAGWTREL